MLTVGSLLAKVNLDTVVGCAAKPVDSVTHEISLFIPTTYRASTDIRGARNNTALILPCGAIFAEPHKICRVYRESLDLLTYGPDIAPTYGFAFPPRALFARALVEVPA